MTALDEAIATARDVVRERPAHDLPLGRRHVVWAAMGDRDDIGCRRRASLAIEAARRALSVWERAQPELDDPHEVLGMAEDLLEGHGDRDRAVAAAGDLWVLVDDLIDEGAAEPPLWAGWAATRAVHVAIDDELFDPLAIDPSLEDYGMPPTRLDAASFAAAAVAGGFPWIEGTDAGARLHFWEWWAGEVRQAVARYGASARGTGP